MEDIYGIYFACSIGDQPIYFKEYDLSKADGKPFYCSCKVYGTRPQNSYTGNTSGKIDELGLILFNLNGQEVLIGVVEFRMCAYLYYKFDTTEEQIIRKNEITREEYFKKNPIS